MEAKGKENPDSPPLPMHALQSQSCVNPRPGRV